MSRSRRSGLPTSIIINATGAFAMSDYLMQNGDYEFDKSAILKKPIDNIKYRAEMQASIRQSKGHCFDHVKSKVARFLKVQKKFNKVNNKKKATVEENNDDVLALMSKALSVEPYGMRFDAKNGSWIERTKEAMKPREEEVKIRKIEFAMLEDRIQ